MNTADSRWFLYEVVGLRQNGEPDNSCYPIRRSGSVFLRVPYYRMSQVMRQVAQSGGTIVSIKPLTIEAACTESSIGDREQDTGAVEGVESDLSGVTEDLPTPIIPQPQEIPGQNPEPSAWWVRISTTEPEVIYYFGPFDSFEEGKDSQGGYIEDLEQEGAVGISVEILWCSPFNLTVF